VGDHEYGSTIIPVPSGLQVPGETGIIRARARLTCGTSRRIFPSKCPSIAAAQIINTKYC